jgi:hypothetical protein
MKPLRWTLESASREFRVSQAALAKYLRQGGVEGDGNGIFTTQEICQAVFGDLKAERLRKEKELTKRYRLENQITEASVLNRAALTAGFAALADAIQSRIMGSELSREIKEDILRDLSTIPIVIKNVARNQSKLPTRRSKNGEEVDDEDED